MIVLDAGVVMAHVDGDDDLHDRATALLAAHADDRFSMSVITRAEVLVRPARVGLLDQTLRALDRLAIETAGLASDAAGGLAGVRAATALRLSDCCVLLAAEQSHADLATFDARLAAVAEGRGVRVFG